MTPGSQRRCASPRAGIPRRFSSRRPEFGRHAASIEAALYFAGVEALQNAAKHAPGAAVTVTIAEREDAVVLEVIDDGPGFDIDAVRAGDGMLNIGDRLGAIGGTARWESSPGSGTRVFGAVPRPEG